MKKLVCNYSVIRFLPYPETEEFVNVGILACCPQVGWMSYCIDKRKTKRVHDFFPEMDRALYTQGRHRLMEELTRFVADFRGIDTLQWVTDEQRDYLITLFKEITRPREEIFRFGGTATLLTEDPREDLKSIYNHYVERHFAQKGEFQETIMKERIAELFRAKHFQEKFRELDVGDDSYHVHLPFVQLDNEDGKRPIKALKPLNLAQEDASKIFDRGDLWMAKIKRLERIGYRPEQMMFAVNLPTKSEKKRWGAAEEICNEFKKDAFLVAEFTDKQAVLSFVGDGD